MCVESVDGGVVAAADALKFVPDADTVGGMNYHFSISRSELR